jgi:GT2 family glycosyltransferase
MPGIGLGIITHNREDYFRSIISKVPRDAVDFVVVVNDGTPYLWDAYPQWLGGKGSELVVNPVNLGCAKSKNIAFRKLLAMGAEHIFIMEDDIIIKSPGVFQKYIDLSNETGIQHFNFALHGPNNKDKKGIKSPRATVDSLSLYPNCVGAFSYYSADCLKLAGLMDEAFFNAFEHVEHTYRIIKLGMHPDFWWFADLANADDYLDDIPWTKESSTISSRFDHDELVFTALVEFHKKHGVNLFSIDIPTQDKVVETLTEIKRQRK